MTLVERFLKYVSFDTQSSEETEITPSTPGQAVARHRLYCPHGYKPRYEWQECFSAYRAEL